MRIISDATGLAITTDEGDLIMLSAEDVSFASVKKYVSDGGRDIADIRALISGTKDAITVAVADAEEVVDGEDGDGYRIAHGDPVADVVFTTAVRVAREGSDPAAVTAFLSRLEKNPSAASRSQLFAWLKAEGFTLTTDGLIVGYKGVTDDYKSVSTGKEPVTVTTADGTATVYTGQITYPIGATVTIPRELVDDNRDASCSVGLHVGTFGYASTFAARTLLVLVDPADVVSVPRHSDGQKMRVSRFVVAAEHNGSKVQETVITVADPSARNEYQARPENAAPASSKSETTERKPRPSKRHRHSKGHGKSSKGSMSRRTSRSRKPRREVPTPALTGVAAEVADSIVAKVTAAPLSNRELGKRFSKARRGHVSGALAHLLETKKIVLGEDKKYALA